MKQRKESKKIIFLILIFSIILISLFLISKSKKFEFQDDLIFFKIFSQSNSSNIKKESEKTNQYNIKVSKEKTVYQEINLMQTIDNKNLINKKIEPGTSGDFEIVLTSNYDLKYQIGFISKNTKPKNLQFYVSEEGKKYNTLEELQQELKGKIRKNEVIKTCIFWEWKYEIESNTDRQDTRDGENIKEYNFEIYTIGK